MRTSPDQSHVICLLHCDTRLIRMQNQYQLLSSDGRPARPPCAACGTQTLIHKAVVSGLLLGFPRSWRRRPTRDRIWLFRLHREHQLGRRWCRRVRRHSRRIRLRSVVDRPRHIFVRHSATASQTSQMRRLASSAVSIVATAYWCRPEAASLTRAFHGVGWPME